MTLKKRISIGVAIGFSLLFGISAIVVFIVFANFRKEEFKERLEEKALTTAKLLLEVKEVDKQLLKLIDQSSINKFYNEKTLVFDEQFNLLYSSIDDASVQWNQVDLDKLKKDHYFYRKQNELDVIGVFYDFSKADYYVIIAAEDKYGNSKLLFLKYTLVITFLTGTLLVWLTTYWFIKRLLQPLDYFQKQIANISVHKLNNPLPETDRNDEINLLTISFNKMLMRIEEAFEKQREFTSNASHEMRTPLTRLSFQVENLLSNPLHTEETKQYLNSMSNDIYQMSDLIQSLLLLAKIERGEAKHDLENERVDEIIFEAIETLKTQYPEFNFDFELINHSDEGEWLEVLCIRPLMVIVFLNLLKNACLYAHDNTAKVSIDSSGKKLCVTIFNRGEIISEIEQQKLYQPFMRGQSSLSKQGSGLGLRIVKRILDYHHFSIEYKSILPSGNVFSIKF